MAVIKFATAHSSVKNVLNYVMRKEATDRTLVDGIRCLPETSIHEFAYVKNQFHKTDGRQYYHIVQSFAPEDTLTPETAHEIGMRFAEDCFPGFQIVVATHKNKAHLHNHIILNSVNMDNGKKFHQSKEELMQVKAHSNALCRAYGLSTTEERCTYNRNPKWKEELREAALAGLDNSYTKEAFIDFKEMHGYRVKWEDNYKYVTFTTPDGHKCRDKNLFDERLLKDNMEMFFLLGGTDTNISDAYLDYETPEHNPTDKFTNTMGLITLFAELLSCVPSSQDCTDLAEAKELSTAEKLRLEKILGKKIEPKAFAYYTQPKEEQQSMSIFY